MEELVQQISQKTGLSEDQARVAAETALNFIKGKLPEPIASQVDGFLSGQSAGGGLSSMLGGLMGGN
jgi:hypothetical protein